MALDVTDRGTASGLSVLRSYLSSWNVTETGASTAYVKFRDSLLLPSAPTTIADGGAGNSTTGLHMFAVTWVTTEGESLRGTLAEFTTAGSKIITMVLPTYSRADGQASRSRVMGRRLYATKAGLPATTLTPTVAQWFLYSADLSTTVAAGDASMFLPRASITVASTTNFAAAGNILVTSSTGVQAIAYTSVDATHFLGCTSMPGTTATGTTASGAAVTQPHIGDNTTTAFNFNLADASLAATNIPTKDTAGRLLEGVKLAAGQSVGNTFGENPRKAEGDGGVYVEVNSGTTEWTVTGT